MEIDRKTLKALAADTRLDILKSLSNRRKTPSELSKELNLATSTVVEHLDKLEEADLIRREETGHKWIYYNLTEKGSALVKPKVPTNFVIVLSLCFLVLFMGFVYYYNNSTNYMAASSRPDALTVPLNQRTTGELPQPPGSPESQPSLEKTTLPAATGAMGNINITYKDCENNSTCFFENIASCNKSRYQRTSWIQALIMYEFEGFYNSDCVMYNKIIDSRNPNLIGKDEFCKIPLANLTEETVSGLIYGYNCDNNRYMFCNGTLTDWRTNLPCEH